MTFKLEKCQNGQITVHYATNYFMNKSRLSDINYYACAIFNFEMDDLVVYEQSCDG
jgi:hypothetical protein